MVDVTKDIYLSGRSELIFFDAEPPFGRGDIIRVNRLDREVKRVIEDKLEYRWKVELVGLFE